MKKIAIFAIDFQNDFCDIAPADLPQRSGQPLYRPALPVDGAVEDVKRFSNWAISNIDKISRLFFTQDSHHYLDIAHPEWWEDANKNTPPPFTPISHSDITSGKWVPRRFYQKSLQYVKSLEDGGEFGHFIWPPHCLMGTWGHNFHDEIYRVIIEAEKRGIWPNIITKGSNPFTEHFGAFRANVPDANDPSTTIDHMLINTLQSMDEVVIVGEARSHCVANSLRQLMQEVPTLAPKLTILTDCMSDVKGLPPAFYDTVQKIYDDAKALGVKFSTTVNYQF
jgi:nicotinamidase-related amidase